MESTPQLLDASRHLLQEGRFHAAADVLLEAFREDPENAEVTRELGTVLGVIGDTEGAVDFLRRSHFSNPRDPQTVAELVLRLREMRRDDDAARALLFSLGADLAPEQIVGYLTDGHPGPAAA